MLPDPAPLAATGDVSVTMHVREFKPGTHFQQVGLLAKNGGNPQAAEIDVSIDPFEIRELGSLTPGQAGATDRSAPATATEAEKSDQP